MTRPTVVIVVVLTAAVLAPWRPRPSRLGPPSRLPRVGSIPSRIGRRVRRIGSLDRCFGPWVSDRVLGAVVLSAVVGLTVAPPLAVLSPVALIVIVARRHRRAVLAAELAVIRGLPEAVDLLALAVAAGMNLRQALESGVAWMPPPFSSVLQRALVRVDSGEALAAALDWSAERLGAEARPLLRILVVAELDGAALMPSLERLGDEARRRRRVQAEEQARRVPVRMLFPLVLCVLPAFALLTVVPLLMGTLADLRVPG